MADMIGFVGVGTMGEPMCRNLARKSGATVLAADRNAEPLQRLAEDGVKTASLDEIVASCRTIFLSLPGGKEVEEVCLGPGGLVAKVTMGYTIVDTSTAPVSLARRLFAEFEGKASAFADSPIARTRQAAIDGTLSIMYMFHADASAALIGDGKVIFAIAEERLNRIKHFAGFPALSVKGGTALARHFNRSRFLTKATTRC